MLTGPAFIPKQVQNVVILCHGYGSDGQDLMGLVPYLKTENTAFFAPNAPTPILHQGGYQWFSLDSFDFMNYETGKKLNDLAFQNLPEITDFIANIQNDFNPQKIILGGFSQGGLIALQTALIANLPISGVMGLSAVPLLTDALCYDKRPFNTDIPVLLTAGTDDMVIPLPAHAEMVKSLSRKGVALTDTVIPHMEHEINMQCLSAMQNFLDTYLK